MERFYAPSGEVHGSSFLIVAAALAAGAVLAPLYAAASLYVPLIYLNVILIVLYGAAVGTAGGIVARKTLTLNPLLAGVFAVVGGWAGFYASWAVWIALVAHFGGAAFPGFKETLGYLTAFGDWGPLLGEPRMLVELARLVNEEGLWSIGRASSHSGSVHGLALLGVWIVEFLIYTISAAVVAANEARTPYSEEAGEFLKRQKQLNRGVAFPDDPLQRGSVAAGLENGDLTYMATGDMVEPGETGYYVTFRSHPNSRWGTAEISLTVKKGKKSETKNVVKNVMVTTQVMQTLTERLR
ncbi:MAG: hypothetical protein LBT40_01925 [Deltaproteobacteria bacterium]|jgi:hypothetical protein|nr:hypothetical protein [Deltaproteobacteria bacterium]